MVSFKTEGGQNLVAELFGPSDQLKSYQQLGQGGDNNNIGDSAWMVGTTWYLRLQSAGPGGGGSYTLVISQG
jgi:hypothetical protein